MTKAQEVEDYWGWFDELVEAHPGAERYRPNLELLRSTGRELIQSLENDAREAQDQKLRSDAALNQRYRAFLVEMTTAAFDKQSTYTTAVLSIGYVGLFTAWNLTSSLISATSSRIVLVSALISLLIFILFEVFKMLYGHIFLMRTLKVIKTLGPDFDVENRRYLDAEEKAKPWFYITWLATLVLTLVFGLAAACILIYAHIERAFFPALA
ncbi:hypothetical protein FJU31_03985 [Stenotrophomonas cyclobalanopsidis]|uniref:Uncharacterized protein n=1 Tax=Stenotrophomonas cyclobalanopsidis TaxID=2771362 RepID=A0ABQ6T4L5_9GAMM|nr:hypothetical protein [Stenotrophomonas cyclobalanopsidis]KAA9003473.1 hypothetical protein FJU31_03985 [Stenotrophomonas cyclobalanopsidis]